MSKDIGNTKKDVMTIEQKALAINLDAKRYGSIVEIGAAQEVARQFFKAGAAAGTIAKTMSAYDMQVSDEIYGKAGRYVSRERVEQMKDKEYELVVKRLGKVRHEESTFFSYAGTFAAKSYKSNNECHGWIGLRLQLEPNSEPSDIVLHVRMLEKTAELQAETLGLFGVNLIYGAFNYYKTPEKIIETLLDNIGQDKLEVDFIDFSGAFFEKVENRLMNLHLIREWLTRAVMFNEKGDSVVPSEAFYKRSPMVVRGSFRPPTNIHMNMFEAGWKQFCEHDDLAEKGAMKIAEITMAELVSGDSDDADFLARVDMLTKLGCHVMVSDYLRFFRLRSYLRQFTHAPIGIVLSVLDFDYLFDEKYYDGLEGGILEAMGKLFPDNTHVYVYPSSLDDDVVNLSNVKVEDHHQHLLDYLVVNNKLVDAKYAEPEKRAIFTSEILKSIQAGQSDWKEIVPKQVAEYIVKHKIFGYPK